MVLRQTNHGHLHARLHKKYIVQDPIPHPPKSIRFTVQSGSEKYGSKVQFTKEDDSTPAILAAAIKILQQYIESLLFYKRSVNMNLLVALITMASAQAHGTEAIS